MTLGVYTDDRCSQISPYEDLTSYINGLYYNYYGNYNQGATVAETYASAIDTWNEKVSSFLLSVYNHYFCSSLEISRCLAGGKRGRSLRGARLR